MVETSTGSSSSGSWEDGAVLVDASSLVDDSSGVPANVQIVSMEEENRSLEDLVVEYLPAVEPSKFKVPTESSEQICIQETLETNNTTSVPGTVPVVELELEEDNRSLEELRGKLPSVPMDPIEHVPAEGTILFPSLVAEELPALDFGVPDNGVNTATDMNDSNQVTNQLNPNSLLTRSIQNALMVTNSSGEKRQQEQPIDDRSTDETKPISKDIPGLWKLAGRKIRQYKAGKVLLNGIRDGMENAKKSLGIGAGKIVVCVPPTVIQPENPVSGQVEFQLTEPIRANRLVIKLQGIQEQYRPFLFATNSVVERRLHTVYEKDYKIAGKQEYFTHASFPFQVPIPRLQQIVSEEAGNTMTRSIPSASQAISSTIEWSLIATLIIPGRLNMSHTVHINVEEG